MPVSVRGRSRIAAVLATMVGLAVLGGAPPALAQPPVPAPAPGAEELGKDDREALADAEVAGASTVTLLVAAQDGATAAAAGDLAALGGVVQETDEAVDYLRVVVPLAGVERAAKLASVAAVDVDALIEREDPRPDAEAAPLPQPAPGAGTPRVNPYLPTADTGAAQFAQTAGGRNDGRGVTIAVIDSGIDLDHPALATTSTGERKIVDWYNANAVDSGDGTWVQMSTARYTGVFTAAGRSWTAPATGGPFAFGTQAETALDLAAGDPQGDLNRDGDRTDVFGVLQDTTTREVYVDTDQDGNFTDNPLLIDYKVRQQVEHFGTDNPATPVREQIAFVVQTDQSNYADANPADFVGLGISANAHGSHVAGITAAHRLFDGQMAGAAPGAKLISIKACLATNACTASGLIEGVLYAARNGADVVNISIGGLPALNDGNNARAELYNRTIAEFNMQLFISAGNSGAGANTVGDPSVATDAISVGSSITDDTWLSNYGAQVASPEALHPFSSRGPREDGGFKPQIVAPGSAISTTPLWQNGGPVAGTYALPPGYSMFNGTSMAAPQTTGAAALLVGAYKAANGGQRPPVAALRTALLSTADFLRGVGAYEQGAGRVDVRAANLLLRFKPVTDTIVTSVPVNTVLSGGLATPNVGVGIHDREGVRTGVAYTREYTITRTSGAAGQRPYLLTWQGNDGTFSSRSIVLLPLNTPVKVPVTVRPRTGGVHSAVLRLDNLLTLGIDHRTMNVVVAPQEFTAANGFAGSGSGTVSRNRTQHFFFRVPQGASALNVALEGGGPAAGAGQVRFVRYDPTGVARDTTSSLNCYNPPVAVGGSCAGGTPTNRTIVNPIAGTWEVVVEARRTSDVLDAPFRITATLLDASIAPDPDVIPAAAVGVPVQRSYTVTNSAGPFTGSLRGGPLGSAALLRPTIANLEQQRRQVTVPAGATALTATIGNPSDAGADLDLIVYNCTTGTCVLAGQSADGDSEESVTIANPAAGAWVVLVDGFAVPAGTTEFDYLDVVVAPQFGTVAVTDADAPRASGAVWTVPGTVTAGAVPAAGRQLLGTLRVQSSEGTTIATGRVIVQSVS